MDAYLIFNSVAIFCWPRTKGYDFSSKLQEKIQNVKPEFEANLL